MKQRWLVAVIGIPFLLAVLLLCPPWATAVLVGAIAGAAAYELLHVAAGGVTKAAYGVTIGFALLQVFAMYAERADYYTDGVIPAGELNYAPFDQLLAAPWFLMVALFLCAVLTFGKPNAVPFSAVAAGMVGGAVFPTMYSCVVLLRIHETWGRLYVLAPFTVAFAGDALAMYFGKWFGGKKLTPVSPNKTWAGFWGGILGSVLGLLALSLIGKAWLGYAPDYPRLACAAAVANLLGQLGDLSTSIIKREAGVKDYSHLFLTHGGVLDRFDSTLFIAPVIYLFVSIGMI